MSRAIRLTVYVMLPVTGIAIVLRHEIVTVLFGYSRFDAAALDLIAATLVTFLVGLTAHALIAILARAFYARHDTRTPVGAAILAVVINSSLAGVLAGPLGLPGLGLAIAIAAWVEAIVLLVLLRRSLRELAFGPIASLGARSLVVTIAASFAAAGVQAGLTLAMGPDPGRSGLIVRAIAVGIVWLLTSAAASLVLRIGELSSIIALMSDLLRRPRRA
jgi:putative peptidoglycan lipid II flippase